eukprot:21584-Heterococcus_DN1.PRE.2
MARFIARTQQKYTQRGGMRPFGVSCMLAGFGTDGAPQIRATCYILSNTVLCINTNNNNLTSTNLYQTDPAGTYSEWKANAIGGKSSKNMREFLEKNCEDGMSESQAIKLCVKALLEVVDSGAKNMEICLIRRDQAIEMLSEEGLDAVVQQIEVEAEEAKAATSQGASKEPTP